MEYRYDFVWKTASTEVKREVLDVWRAHGALDDAAAAKRIDEVLVIARTERGEIAGVSTAVDAFVPLLDTKMYYFRAFVTDAHRMSGIGREMLRAAYEVFNARYREGENRDIPGFLIEIANPLHQKLWPATIWQSGGLHCVYIGKSQTGSHLRVWYFEGSRLAQ
jgi:hypothetical protein